MGSPQSCNLWHRNKHAIIFLLFLSVSSFIHVRSIAEGRAILKPLMEATKVQIGSRPPSCLRRCRDCGGHCEAVQVPVALSHDTQNRRRRRSSHGFASVSGEVEISSNYKPMSWKCKCGNFIFNP